MVSFNKKQPTLLLFLILTLSGCSNNAVPGFVALSDRSFSEYHFNLHESNFNVESIAVDDNFVFSQSTLPPISVLELIGVDVDQFYDEDTSDSILMDFFLNSIIDLLGFDETYIYVLSNLPMIDGPYDYDGFFTTVSRINLVEKYIDYHFLSIGPGSLHGFHLFEHMRFFDSQIFLYYLWVRESPVSSGLLDSELMQVIFGYEIRTIFTNNDNRITNVAYTNNYMILNYIDGDDYVLALKRFDEPDNMSLHGLSTQYAGEFIEIFRSEFIIEDGILYTGQLPIYAGGDENGVYFQVITLDREMLDFEGTSALYHFSLETRTVNPVFELSDKITYMSGNDDLIILNYYSIDAPTELTGRIFLLNENAKITIPYITPMNDIIQTFFLDDLVFIVSRNYLTRLDLGAQVFENFNIRQGRYDIVSGARINNNALGFLRFLEESVVFNKVELE